MRGLERIREAKEVLREIASTAHEDGIISMEEMKDLINKCEQDKLRIGIIGQVKAGKSTLINALIFKKKVMPASSTPMTASLCFLTYGARPIVEVEFFSKSDWDFITREASKDDEDSKWARELVNFAKPIQHELSHLLGSTKEISFSDLSNYVGSKGKYTPVAKALHVKYPERLLNDVEIVDTPGINDPIVSREKRTKEFLEKCDVVLFMTYGGRAFDATDMSLLDRLMAVGVGRTCIVINKKDSILEEEGNLEKVKERVRNLVGEAVRKAEENGELAKKEVLEKAKERVVAISSLWALIGSMKEKVMDDEDLKWYYDKHREEFPWLKTYDDFYKESGLEELEKEIMSIVENEKFEILLRRPVMSIVSKYDGRRKELDRKIGEMEKEKENLDMDLKDLQEELVKLEKVQESYEELIAKFEYEIRRKLYDINKTHKENLGNKLRELKEDMENIINSIEVGRFTTKTDYRKKIGDELDKQWYNWKSEFTKHMEKCIEDMHNAIEKSLEELHEEIITASEKLTFSKALLYQLLSDTFELIRKGLKVKEYDLQLMREYTKSEESFFGIFDIFGKEDVKREAINRLRDELDRIKKDIDDKFSKDFEILKNYVLGIKSKIENEVLEPVKNSIDNAIKNKHQKERRIKELESEINKLKKERDYIEGRKRRIEERFNNFLSSLAKS